MWGREVGGCYGGGGCLVGKQPVEELGYHRIRLCYVLVQIADSSWHPTRNLLEFYGNNKLQPGKEV